MDDDKKYAEVGMRLVLVWSSSRGEYVWVEPGKEVPVSLRVASSLSLCEALTVTRNDGVHLIAPKESIIWVRKLNKEGDYVFFESGNKQVATQELPAHLRVTVRSIGKVASKPVVKKKKVWKYFYLGKDRFRC